MRGFLTDRPPMVLHEWLHKRIGLPWSTDFRALARVVDGQIVGCVGYEGFTGTSCRMHMAGEGNWITREFIRKAFRYPFNVLGLPMVFGVVPSGNRTALEIDLRLGFTELIYIDGAHPDGGLHFLQLKREDWQRTMYGTEST
jgi:RimJ/RimL family protein N-acetyltransferase